MSPSRVLAVATATAALALAPTAARADVVPSIEQHYTVDGRCETFLLSTPPWQAVDAVTLCTPKVIVAAWIVSTSSTQELRMCGLVPCVRVYTPAAGTWVDPIVVRVHLTSGTTIEQVVPAGTMRLTTPNPSCLVNTDPADPDRCWA